MSAPTLPPVGASQVAMQDINWAGLPPIALALMSQMGLSEAAQQQGMDQLHGQVQQYQQQADQAQKQYSQAAQTPDPQAGQPPNFFDQLAGGAASIASRNPTYQSQAQDRGDAQMKAMADARASNLKMLRDHYERQAMAAEQMGKIELAAQMRSKVDSVDKAQQSILDSTMQGRAASIAAGNKQGGAMEQLNTRGDQQMDLQKLKGQQAMQLENLKGSLKLALEKAKPGSASPDYLNNAIIHTDSGDVVDVGGLVGNAKNAAIKFAYDNNMVPADKDQTKILGDIQGAKQNVLSILQQAGQVLPQTPQDRPAWATHVWAARATQSDPFVVAFDNWRSGAIKNLRATAGSGGLRINQREIELAVKYDIPSIFDTQPVAQQKMQNIMTMLSNGERVLTSRNWKQQNDTLLKRASFPTTGKVTLMSPDGKTEEVEASEAQGMIANKGYARVVNPEWAFGDSPPSKSGKAADNDPEGIRALIGK